MIDSTIYWLWLSLAVTPGSDTFSKLVLSHPSAEEIHSLDRDDLIPLIGSKSKDLLALWHNPYIKRDHTCRIDLYRNKGDAEPIDCFESKSTHAFSARAMLLLGASLLGIWALTRVFGKE